MGAKCFISKYNLQFNNHCLHFLNLFVQTVCYIPDNSWRFFEGGREVPRRSEKEEVFLPPCSIQTYKQRTTFWKPVHRPLTVQKDCIFIYFNQCYLIFSKEKAFLYLHFRLKMRTSNLRLMAGPSISPFIFDIICGVFVQPWNSQFICHHMHNFQCCIEYLSSIV